MKKNYRDKAVLFCDAINRKYGVSFSVQDLSQVYWSGPTLCAHFKDLKPGRPPQLMVL